MNTAPRSQCLAAAVAVLPFLALCAAPASADDVGAAEIEIGDGPAAIEALVAAGRCDELPAALEAVAGGWRQDASLRIAAARCDIRLERYEQASANLRAARQLAPERGDIDLWEGVVEYHLGHLDEAQRLLERAQVGSDEDRAYRMLYHGRVSLALAERTEARETLDRNRRPLLRVVSPVDLYYATDPWTQGVLRGQARRDLEGVGQYDDGGLLADEVRAALDDLDGPRGPWIAGAFELGGDDNFVLLGSGADTPAEMSQKSGMEFVPRLFIEGGGELFRTGGWSGGLLSSFYGTFPTDNDHLDTVYPTVSAFLDKMFGERKTFRTRYDFGYAWVDGDSFTLTNDATFEFHNRSDAWGETLVWANGYYNIFYDDQVDFPVTDGVVEGICDSTLLPPPFPPSAPSCAPDQGELRVVSSEASRRDRSGWGFLFGGRQRKQFEWNDTEVRGGYTYQHYIPDGAEFHNQSHGLDLGVNTALPYGFALDTWVGFTYQGMRNVSVYPEPNSVRPNRVWANRNYRRHETIWEVAVAVQRRFLENFRGWIEYRYANNDSNHGIFDYDRNVVRVGVSAILY